MLIKKLPARKISPLPPFLRRLVVKIFEAKEKELPEILRKFVDVSLPKSDLNNWIGILNKFDRLLEDLIAKYELTSIQKTDFSLQDKELILAILALTKSLFDKCTNRNLYCSYERLNDLLNTNDLDVLEMVLSVIMRPAQRVNAQRSVRVNFLISQDRISTLASNWGLADPNTTLKELASPAKAILQESFPINFQFYGKAEAKASSKDKGSSKLSSSSKKEKPSEGATTDSPQVSILVTDPFSKGATSSEIFYKLVEEFNVPEDQWYPLFQKIRISTAVSNPLQRIKLLSVRLLALSVFCYVASETVVTRSVFVYEPNLILTLAGLLHPECDAPISIQTATLHSLDSISHFSTKLSEVLAAVGASTNHGVLLCMLKKVIASETADDSGFLLLVDALFSLLSYIFTSQSGGNMLVTAGIVSLLVQFIGGEMVQAPVRLRYKGIQLMDNAIYGFPTAFSSFQASNGLTTLVQRIDEQVDLCMRLEAEANAGEMEGILLIENLILLKGLVKFVLHMMQTSSTGVGLRNLIDSRLPASLKKIFEQPGLFSPMVYGQAVNVMSTIIHNEPTSLSILQEQELPQAFLKTAVAGFPAAAESLYPISNAFGAICLNTPGLELFTELGTLDKFFDIFISPEHVYVLEEPEVLTLLGGSFDELTRHHPALKAPVIQNIVRVIRELINLGGDGFSAWAAEMAPYMERNNEESLAKHLRSAIDDATDKPEYGSVQLDEQPDQFLIRFIDAICKFLDGFFQSSSHFDTFQAQGGYEALLEIYSLPALPVDFPSLPAAANLVQVFRSANEGSVGPIITAVMNRLCATLDQCKPWLEHVGHGSTIVQWLRAETPDHTERISEFHHHGRALHGLTDLLSDFSDPSLFTQGNVGAALLQAVLSAGFGRILPRLGHVLRTTQWECILMQSEQLVTELDGGSLSYVDSTVKSVYNVLAQANSHLTSFFQGLVKVSMTRRIMARPLKQDARAVLLEVATELRDYFGFDRVTTEPTVASLKYHATGLAFLTLQLLDRRHQMFIHLLMLMAFEKVGGFETFFACMDNSWKMFESKRCSDPQLERSLKKNIEIGLVLMEHLSSHRYYADCPYLPNILPGSTPEETVDPAYPSDYLSKYRHRTARFLASLWTSPAVGRLQKSHVRSMAIATGYIVKSQALRHDTTHRPRAAGAHGGALSGLFSLRRPGPDQEQIQQLVDMGFPRDASESALTRFGNNMSRAAEYLLTHPEVVAAASFHSPQPPAEENSTQEDTNEEPPSDMGASEEDDSDVLFFKADIHEIPSSEESEAMRAHLRSNILLPVFQVLDNVEETVHFLRDLIVMLVKTGEDSTQVSDQFRSEIKTCLDDPNAHGIPLARRLRLLGFLLIDEVVVRSVLGLATELFDPLVRLVSKSFVFPPAYLSTALVVIEVVLMYSDEPNLDDLQPGVALAPNLVTVDTPLLESKVVLTSHRDILTQNCMGLLGHVAARDSDVLIALVRLLMRLTREPDHARFFVKGGGVEALLTPMRSDLNRYMGQHVHVVIILRHLIETRAVLLEGFEAHIHRWLSTNKSRNVEIFSFLKQNSNLVLRDPLLFVEATVRKCKLTRYEPEGRMPQISLVDPEPPKPDGVSNTQLALLEPPSTQVMFYLIGEILSFKDQPEAPSSDESNDAGSLYQCLLLQCLAELFYCFPGCRLEFLSSNRNKASGVALPIRSRSLFINYLLNDILPYEAGDPRADPKADAKLITQSPDNKSARASNVIASLLIGSNNVFLEANYRELASMRLFVLDLIYRAFQEAMSLPSLTQRHSKVMSLCDLCFKVLTSKRPLAKLLCVAKKT
ncbi:E3 ubiquitin-protein ligase tom1 [Entomophthora muscae]|uniref:E3 ubiquitin-protein ligase tom1 n=1 Tax=Entomophthora muscae TaxID=34485 RepID=A0ACC2UPZ5_9FUNG|nr:E3 ubiquitin-protein ligase tom1 [Entomophthora muscae]